MNDERMTGRERKEGELNQNQFGKGIVLLELFDKSKYKKLVNV